MGGTAGIEGLNGIPLVVAQAELASVSEGRPLFDREIFSFVIAGEVPGGIPQLGQRQLELPPALGPHPEPLLAPGLRK